MVFVWEAFIPFIFLTSFLLAKISASIIWYIYKTKQVDLNCVLFFTINLLVQIMSLTGRGKLAVNHWEVRFLTNFRFLTKTSIFDQEFDVRPKVRFSTKSSIFDQISIFDQKFDFLTKRSIFDQISSFYQKFGFWPNFDFRPNFDF